MKRVLIVCPNTWEQGQLVHGDFAGRDDYELILHGEDAEGSPASFDALAFVAEAVARFRGAGLHGVASSSDYPGCLVAAAIAHELGLPGPHPRHLLRCSHKYYARLLQREAVPEATPAFALLDPDDPRVDLPFPLFVKPVKSWFSVFARRVEDRAELASFLGDPALRAFLREFTRPFNQILGRYSDLPIDASRMLAEQCLSGHQVTVEGYVWRGEVHPIGVTDSVMYPGTISFQRFEYPSRLPEAVQARMDEVVARAVRRVGLDGALFNVELFYRPDSGAIHVIEINPRMVGQFADLHEKVDGTNTFAVLLALATGQEPRFQRGRGRYRVAASFPQRIFRDQRLVRNPSAADVAAVRARFPGAIVKTYLAEGQHASDPGDDQNDLASYLYAVINLGADGWDELLAAEAGAQAMLGFRFE